MKRKIFIPLRDLRKSCGITVEEMATRLGVTKQAISRWELGQSYPELHYLPQIAEMCNVSTDFLLSYKPPNLEITNDDEATLKNKYFWKPTINLILSYVLKYLPPTKPLRVLEIGCDDGYCALALARLGYIVTAFDNSAIKIEKIKQLAKLIKVNVSLSRENLLDYAFDGQFDIIYSLGALKAVAIRDRASIFEKIKSHTNENGINIFETVAQKNFDRYDFAENDFVWKSGELFSFYADWQYEIMEESILT
ncbi:MAG: helix-turn-helix domain-containing protein, partial [Selenomonadaceae bacterium]|nr:helix-turn-helix domain-containing protein [Selenomonadaceae bacterium]